MAEEGWIDKMDRLGRAVWELLHSHPELDYVQVEANVEADERFSHVLATDVNGGVLWIDQDGDNNRQIVLPDGTLARNAEWLAERRGEQPATNEPLPPRPAEA